MIRATNAAAVSGFSGTRHCTNKSSNFNKLTIGFGAILQRALPETHAPALPGTPAGALDLARAFDKRPTGQPDLSFTGGDTPKLDPLELAFSRPPAASAVIASELGPTAVGGRATAASIDVALVEQIVRRVVWGGDRRRGVARIELDGALSGTSICVRGEGRELELELSLGPGVEGAALAERLLGRLRSRGIEIARWDVR